MAEDGRRSPRSSVAGLAAGDPHQPGPAARIPGDQLSAGRYDATEAADLATRWGVPAVVAFDTTRSTLDETHRLASLGAPHGTVVLADQQTGGRGRHGRRWSSGPGRGIWLTLLARDSDPEAVQVMAIRLGLRAAAALDAPALEMVGLKWPNDLYVGARKLAGILVEARWHAGRVAWLAAGIGVNVYPPRDISTAAGLTGASSRLQVLDLLMPSLIDVLAAGGGLSHGELAAFRARDVALGRRAVAPVPGTVKGIAADGALLVETDRGECPVYAGSLLLDPPLAGASLSGAHHPTGP